MKQICLKNKFLCTVNNLTKGDLKMCDYEKTEYDAPCGSCDVTAGQLKGRTRPKYYNILNAVDRLVDTRMRVQKLCDEIVGTELQTGIPDDAKQLEEKPSLLDVLDKTPGIISQELDMIIGAVNEIEAQIL